MYLCTFSCILSLIQCIRRERVSKQIGKKYAARQLFCSVLAAAQGSAVQCFGGSSVSKRHGRPAMDQGPRCQALSRRAMAGAPAAMSHSTPGLAPVRMTSALCIALGAYSGN